MNFIRQEKGSLIPISQVSIGTAVVVRQSLLNFRLNACCLDLFLCIHYNREQHQERIRISLSKNLWTILLIDSYNLISRLHYGRPNIMLYIQVIDL